LDAPLEAHPTPLAADGRKKKVPTIVGEAYEMLLIKLLRDNIDTYSAVKELTRAGVKTSHDSIEYYRSYYAGRINERYDEVCRTHRTLLEHSITDLKSKIGKNASSLQQLNYYVEVLNIEIEIVRNYTPDLKVSDREDMLEKLIGRVQNLMTLKNKYVSDLDRKDNIKKIILDIIGVATDTLLHESLTPDQKKELLDKFKEGVKEYIGFVE